MAEHLIKTPGTYDELDIRCPSCSSRNVTIFENSQGYYDVIKCSECGLNKKSELI
ncbi:MAG: hypothetical protein AABX54_02590 [Nanoarchaeota archaeon]